MQVYMKQLKVIITINMNLFYQNMTIDKNLFSDDRFGSLDLQTNYKLIIMIQIKIDKFFSK